jgi:hypothetical protein
VNDTLERRYEALYRGYKPNEPETARLRKEIEDAAKRENVKLRADASHFLLLNFDEMIYQAYSHPIVAKGALLPQYGNFSPPYTENQIRKSLDVVLQKVRPDDEGLVSAHAVIKAIDASWATLADYLGWG